MAKKIRTAVIGVGHFGRLHATKFHELEEAELVAVVDVDEERASAVAKELGTTPYTDYRKLAGMVDAVSIVTPTITHYRIARFFLSKGVDVLIEKPMTANPAEAAKLIKEAEKRGVVLQVGLLERFNPAVKLMREKVKAPLFIESHRLSPFSSRALDTDVIYDLMIHDIDIVLSLVDSDVEMVDAVGVPVMSGKIDIASARLRFKTGCVANITASRVSREKQRRIRVFQPCTYLSIDYDTQRATIMHLKQGGDRPTLEKESPRIKKGDPLMEEIKAFLEASRKRLPPQVPGSEGKRALEVAKKIKSSIRLSIEKARDQLEGVLDLSQIFAGVD